MVDAELPSHSLPSSRLPFRPSRAVMGLLLATIMLVVILIFSTLQNINRAQDLMEGFLLEKGKTIIRSIEAVSRTSVMHHMGGGNPLHTFLAESTKEEDIAYITISDIDGSVIDQAGYPSTPTLTPNEINAIIKTGKPIGKMHSQSGVFSVSKAFRPKHHMMVMGMQNRQLQDWLKQIDNNKIISIGLLTREFDIARKQDVHHAFFMAAILLLVGSAGLYFLFLYQGMRVARSKLSDMKLYTDSVIESIPVSLITLDADNRIFSCNRNTEDLLGVPFNRLKGQHINTALPVCSVCVSEICNDTFDHSAECTTEHGTTVPVRISCSSLLNQHGEQIGKVLIIRDMSSIRDMELQLERSRRMAALGKMAAGIAHEIRNPLGTLRGFAQFFGTKAESDDEKKYADLMVSEVDRLNQTVSGLLQFARPREPQLQHFLLDDLFGKVMTLMKSDFANKDLIFNCRPETDIRLHADPDLLLQVLMNLLKNSINATEAGNEISLTAGREEGVYRISVSDTGRGMSEQERERMFDPFFTTGKTGTGLGLAVSHQIIEQHNGSFEIQTAEGKGTTITILLPQEQEGSTK